MDSFIVSTTPSDAGNTGERNGPKCLEFMGSSYDCVRCVNADNRIFTECCTRMPTIPLKLWLLGLPIAIIISFYIFFLESYLYWKTSLWLGGHSEKSKMRIVFAWSATIRLLGFVLIDTIFSLLLGKENLLVLIADSIAAMGFRDCNSQYQGTN